MIDEVVHKVKEPGIYTVEFDGSRLASGVDFDRLTTGGFVQTRRMIIVK